MPHRRLVRALAFTVALALIALLIVAVPALSSPAGHGFYQGPSTDHFPSIVAGAADAGSRVKIDHDDRWNIAVQQHEEIVSNAGSARGTGRTGPAPAPSGDALEAIAAHFPDVYDAAVRVADCESSLIVGNVSSGGGNWGLFQINRAAHESDFVSFANAVLDERGVDVDDPRRSFEGGTLNADLNAAYARKLWNGSGWGPWSCRWAA